MKKSNFFVLLLLAISAIQIDGLHYQLLDGIATFRLDNDDTTIGGVPRNSQGVVKIKLSCGLNRLSVENKVTEVSSLELIHNCIQTETRLVGLFLNSTWITLNEVNDDDEISIAVEAKYEVCYDDGIDRCDGSLWWLQVGGNEMALLGYREKCESGEINEEYARRMCKRPYRSEKSTAISDSQGVYYDGQVLKGVRAKQFSMRTSGSPTLRRMKRDAGDNTCDYTIESTSTSTTTPTTTTVTSTVTSTTTVPTSTSTVTTAMSTSTSTPSTSTTIESTSTTFTSTASTSTSSTSTTQQSSSTITSSPSSTTLSTSIPTTTTPEITSTLSSLPDNAICSYLDETTTSTTFTTTMLTSTTTEEPSTSTTTTEVTSTSSTVTTTEPTTTLTTSTASTSTTEPSTSTVTTSPSTSPVTSTVTSSSSSSTTVTTPTSTESTSTSPSSTVTTSTTAPSTSTTGPSSSSSTPSSTASSSVSSTASSTQSSTSTQQSSTTTKSETTTSSDGTNPDFYFVEKATTTFYDSTSVNLTLNSGLGIIGYQTSIECTSPTSSNYVSTTKDGACFTKSVSMPRLGGTYPASTFVGPGNYTFRATMTTDDKKVYYTYANVYIQEYSSTTIESESSTSAVASSTSSTPSTPSSTLSTSTVTEPSSTRSSDSTTTSAGSTTTLQESTTTSEESTTDSSTTTISDTSTTSSSPSSTTADSTSTLSVDQFDFILDSGLSWNETRHNEDSINIVPLPTNAITPTERSQTFECRNVSTEPFLIIKESTCLNYSNTVLNATYSSNIPIQPIETFLVGIGTYEFRINMTDLTTMQVVSHIFTLNVVADSTSTSEVTSTTSTGSSSESSAISTTSGIESTSTLEASTTDASQDSSTSTSDSGTTSDSTTIDSSNSTPSTSDSSGLSQTPSDSSSASDSMRTTTVDPDASTETPYDFVLENLTWNETVYYSENPFYITPIPNKEPGALTTAMTCQCRNDSSQPFVLLKESNCLTEFGKNGAYSASVSFNPMTSFVPATGTYEFLINVTNRASGESASHIFTMNVVLPTTTTETPPTTVSSSDDAGGKTGGTGATGGTGGTGSGGSATTLSTGDAVRSTTSGSGSGQSSTGSGAGGSGTTASGSGSGGSSGTGSDGVNSGKTTALNGDGTGSGTATTPGSHLGDGGSTSGSGSDSNGSSGVSTKSSSGSDTSGSSDSSGANGAFSATAQPSTRTTKTRSSLATVSPISAAEQAIIDAQKADVMNQLAGIMDGSASNNSLNTSSSLLNQISSLPAADLVEVAQSLLSNTLKIPGVGNMSSVDVLKTLQDNIATTNSELADEMAKVITKLANVNMTSAQSLNSVLSSLDLALKGSTVYTLGVSSTKSKDGTYAVIFGYVIASGYTLVSPRCTLSIYGSTIYLTGDTRASYKQLDGDTVTADTMLAAAIGIQGMFATNGRTVQVEQDKIDDKRSLVSGNIMATMSGVGDVQSGEYSYNDMYVTAWNVTYDNSTVGSTSQKNTSFSFNIPVSEVQYILLIESGTMIKLHSTQNIVSRGLVVTASYGGVTYTITCTNGTGKFVEVDTDNAIFSYNADSFTVVASDGSSASTVKKLIQMPIVIENVNLALFNQTTSPLVFSNAGSYSMRMVLSPQDIGIPAVSALSQTVSISTLSPTASYTKDDLQSLIKEQTLVTVSGTLFFSKASSIDVSGYSFFVDSTALYLSNSVTTLVISSPTYNIVSLALGGYGIQITAGTYTSGSQTHTVTLMEFSDTQKMRIDGGLIIRNGTNGYVIQNGQVSTEGDVSGTKIDIVPQSLMNQESQQQIETILSNTQDFLTNNGMTMTDAEINDTSNSLLSIAGSLTSALKIALDNPLSSDLAANLKYATDNYDSLYNVLPSDPDNIVYVEEMTSEEWAAYVTKMFQKNIAKNLANQLASTLDTLENTLAARAIATGNLPYDYSNSVDGTGMVIVIDDASNIVGKTQNCEEWAFKLPSPASTLNTAEITDKTLIQVGLVCYATNPRTYVDNFDMLITSGALEAHIKDENQIIIPITGTTAPIYVNGRGSEDDAVLTLMQQGDFASYQILDLHAFRTTNWNNSLQVEIIASQDYEIPNNDDTYMFSSFQSLPGPLESNHEWIFDLNTLNKTSNYFVTAGNLINNTGLFFIGIGKRNSSTNTGNSSDIVNYGQYDSMQWSFARSVPMDYQVAAVSKGCYFYQKTSDVFNSEGMYPSDGQGMQFVNCSTDHLTMFSVGAFNPTIDADFSYNYNVNEIEKNVKVMIAAVFMLVVYGCLTINAIICQRKDASRGRLRFLKDNEPHDGYMYVIAVETGYRMFATTDSTICFNLSGNEGDQIFRSFRSEEDGNWEFPFSWGTTDRFVMTTAFPLGELEYMRLWLDDAGLDHRESWYCNRIIVKDLQTQDIYYFPFNNWLGTKNGDGETERLARVEYKRRFLDESMSMHMLAQTISWFAMFTGGGNRLRDRVSRQDYSVSIIFSLVVVSMISITILKSDNSIISDSKSVSEFTFTIKDIAFGVGFGVLITFLNSLHILLCTKCRSHSEHYYYKKRKREDPEFKDNSGSWPMFMAGMARTIIVFPVLMGLIYISGAGMSLMDDLANSFYIRFLISLILWAVVFEPIKGLIWAFLILKTRKSHKIINKLEEALLRAKPAETFLRNPYGKIEKGLGTEIADVTKLRDTENRKMRDEQLFITIRDMLCFFASLYIMVMLTYYCKDRHGYWYQLEMSTILNINQKNYGDNTFMSIQHADDFWDWARESLATALLASWYDGNPAYGMRAYMNDKVSRSMGIGTIRQVRTKKSAECTMFKQFQGYINDCGEELTSKNEEKTLYMQAGWTELESENGTDASDEYTYKTSEELSTETVSGLLYSYSGGGYTISMSGTQAEIITLFNKLDSERWIDDHTRAVIIEFSAYNAQINYFSVVQLLVEIPKSGIYLPNSWVESVRLIKSEGSDGTVVKYYEMLYIFFSVLIFVKEIVFYLYGRYKVITTMKPTRNPFKIVYQLALGNFSPWNFMDLIVGALAVASVLAYTIRQRTTNRAMEDFNANNGNSYINLTEQRNWEIVFSYCLAGAVFFTSCKMIRILRFNRRIGVLAATLDNALGAIVSFGIAFLFFSMTFNSVLYAVLGNKMGGYRSLMATFQTALAGMLGKLDVTSIQPISQFAFVVIMLYMIAGSKLVLQLYVTIIMFEFEEIRNDSEKQTNDYEIIDHIKYKTKRRLGLLEPKDFAPVSIADTQKDFRLFHSAVAKVNLLHHRATRMLQTQGQYQNQTVINYTLSYDPVSAIHETGPKRFQKWRLNDVEKD